MNVVRPAVELDDSFCVDVQSRCIFQDRSPSYITCHFVIKLPVTANLALFGSKLLYVFFDLPAEEDLLKADKCAVLERQLFVLEEFTEVGTQLGLMKLDKRRTQIGGCVCTSCSFVLWPIVCLGEFAVGLNDHDWIRLPFISSGTMQ